MQTDTVLFSFINLNGNKVYVCMYVCMYVCTYTESIVLSCGTEMKVNQTGNVF